MKKINVKMEEQETTIDILADSIKSISDGMKKLRSGRLNQKALVLLIQHASPAPNRDGKRIGSLEIKSVLEGIESLEKTYLK